MDFWGIALDDKEWRDRVLYDAISVFGKKLSNVAEQWQSAMSDDSYTGLERRTKFLVDNYVPKDGTYVLINVDKGFVCESPLEIRFDKKSGELQGRTEKNYNYVRYLDYNSKLIEMNKPVDNKKVIHSNQMFSFWVKKDSIAGKKLTKEVVNNYYKALRAPELKYTKTAAGKLYKQVTAELGEPDRETIDQIAAWIKGWMEDPGLLPVDLSGKDYLKLFFVYDDEKKTKELYEKENRRYLIPNIYNNNDYNVESEGGILGVPSNNMGLNAKKPFLENKNRKTSAPYLVDLNRVMLQNQFFDYLWGHACKGNVNVYIDLEEEEILAIQDKSEGIPDIHTGMYIRIKKGKEVEILESDVVLDLSPNLSSPFYFKEIIKTAGNDGQYGEYTKAAKLAALVDEVFFDKYLGFNYFTDPADLPQMDGYLKYILLTYRSRLFAWLYRTPKCDMRQILPEMAVRLIRNKIAGGNLARAGVQLNLLISLEDYLNNNNEKEEIMGTIQEEFKIHIDMLKEDWEFSDSEYYYAVGQMVGYFLSLSKSAKKPLSMANQFLNADNDRLVKEKLGQMFIRYDHAIDADRDVRAKNVLSHIMTYEPKSRKVMQRELIAGLTANSAFYMKKEQEGGQKQ